MMLRTLLDVDLFEVTMTSCPAYEATSVSVRSKMFPDSFPTVPEPEPASVPEVREADTNEDPGCQCSCESCLAGDCSSCSDDDCDDEECRCGEMRTNKMLAVLQRLSASGVKALWMWLR